VALSVEGAVVTQITGDGAALLATTGVELTEGRRYWEVELLSEIRGEVVGIGCYLF
jgi:hypothetical protein